MKLFLGAGWIVGACAAAAVQSSGCVVGLQADLPLQANGEITFKPTCGEKLGLNAPYGVFAAPNGTDAARGSLVGGHLAGAQLGENGVTIGHDSLAGVQSVIVTAETSRGTTLLQSFDLRPSSADVPTQTVLHDARDGSTSSTCSACQNRNILCQSACQNPPKTCDFYSSCAEASVPCGASGYALGYGLKNCSKFMQRLSSFSSAGQAWIFRVMTCLQKFFIDGPLLQCGLTCDALKADAFGSHPTCYVDSGVCDLPVGDWVQLVVTIREDLLTLDTLRQAVTTGGDCLGHYAEELQAEIEKLEGELKDGVDRARILGELAVLEAVKKIFG